MCVTERERERERERQGHITVESAILTTACVHTHTKHPHYVCHVTMLPSRLELMVKLMTLLTVFIKPKACDYGKGCYISEECLRCSANHNALCQLANQSRLRLSEGGTLRKAGHRGLKIMYSI